MKVRLLLSCILFFTLFALKNVSADANPMLSLQREAYQIYLKGLKENNPTISQTQLLAIKAYPLYRYAQYRYFLQFSQTVKPDELVTFLLEEPDSAVNPSLVAFFVNKWGEMQQYEMLAKVYAQIDLFQYNYTVQDKCYLGEFLLVQQEKQRAYEIVNQIWLTGKSLPKECDRLVAQWLVETQPTDLIFSRILLAIENKNTGLIAYLAKLLPKEYKDLKKSLISISQNPNYIAPLKGLKVTSFTQKVAIALFDNLSQKELSMAIKLMPDLLKSQQLENTQKNQVEDILFKRLLLLNTPTSAQLTLREQLFGTSINDELIETRIRIALREDDWDTIMKGINKLSDEGKQSQTWRYFYAMGLNRLGGHDRIIEAENLLTTLSAERGFYPMLASQKLKQPYQLIIEPAQGSKEIVLTYPAISRIQEFLHWHQTGQANREWLALIDRTPANQQPYLARFALENGWHQLAVQATISTKLWDNIYERFPIGWYDLFLAETEGKIVPKPYALAIARQESAWNAEVTSPAGAIGLMQIMPATAEQVAKKNEITTFTNTTQLMQPAMNIKIGVQYLHDLLSDYGGNRILATAAYNAGPSRVTFWLNRTNSKVDSAQFIEAISFPETRQYVKNVLSFDMYYRILLKQKGLLQDDVGYILSETEYTSSY